MKTFLEHIGMKVPFFSCSIIFFLFFLKESFLYERLVPLSNRHKLRKESSSSPNTYSINSWKLSSFFIDCLLIKLFILLFKSSLLWTFSSFSKFSDNQFL